MQEDPLYDIKKKEIESKTQLLKNPVKLQQLKQMVSDKIRKNATLYEELLNGDR